MAGIWSFVSVIIVPMVLFLNFRGGIDVTEYYSDTPTNPLRASHPILGTAAKENKSAQWAMLAFLSIALLIVLVLVLR